MYIFVISVHEMHLSTKMIWHIEVSVLLSEIIDMLSTSELLIAHEPLSLLSNLFQEPKALSYPFPF